MSAVHVAGRPGRARRAAGVAAVAALVIGGCTSEEEPVERPEGSVALVQNRPTPVGDLTVVASHIDAGSAAVSVLDTAGGAAAEGGQAELGETATIGPLTFEVVDIALAEDRGGEPGSDTSTVWILPR